MRTYLKISPGKLAVLLEESLTAMGYAFIKNIGLNVTEFEVQRPARFILAVENQTREQIGYPFRSRIKVESALEWKRLIGSNEPDGRISASVSAILKDLGPRLPADPWKGAGVARLD